MGQLIYIEQKDRDEATRLLKGFTVDEQRKKTFINSLGAELIMKYLAQEGVNVSNIFNMHNIFRLREEFELADVMLPNIHIDVRMIYDENLIFVPKSHFEYNLIPDIYVVLKASEDGSYADFLGFFEPAVIDKTKQNEEYYFIDKSKLQSCEKFISYVRAFNGNTTQDIDADDEIPVYAMSLADNDIAEQDKKDLIEFLKKSSSIREQMIEFDNFEWLSYTLTQDENVEKNFNKTVDEFDTFDAQDEFSMMDDNTETNEESLNDEIVIDDTVNSDIEDEPDLAEVSMEESVIENSGEEIILENLQDLQIPELENNVENINLSEDVPLMNMPEVDSLDEETLIDAEVNTEEASDEELVDMPDAEDTPFGENTDIESEAQEEENLIDLPEDQEENFAEDNNSQEIEQELVDMPEVSTETSEIETSQEDELVSLEDLEGVLGEDPNNNNTENAAEIENISDLEDFLSESGATQEIPTTVENTELFDNQPSELNDIEDRVEEPAEISPASYENSTVISNETPVAGEIPVDINNEPENESIEVLYSEAPERNIEESTETPEQGKKGILVVAAVAAVLAVGGVAGYFAMNSNKDQMAGDIPPIPENTVPQPKSVEENPLPEDAIQPKAQKISKEETDDLVAQAKATNKTAIESAYIEVKKLGWAVPEYASYNDAFRNYLQTVGKSLKLALSSDLLSATEYPYSNQINVDIEMSNTGSLLSYKISKSSGSAQIDKIVLQTVKETIVVVKVPSGVIVGDKIRMTLKIYL